MNHLTITTMKPSPKFIFETRACAILGNSGTQAFRLKLRSALAHTEIVRGRHSPIVRVYRTSDVLAFRAARAAAWRAPFTTEAAPLTEARP